MIHLTDLEWDEEPVRFLQQGLEKYLDRIFDAVLSDDSEDFTTESSEPFCGCETCYIRETLAYTLPRILDLYINGNIRLQHTDKEGTEDGLQLVSNSGVVEQEGGGVQE